MNEEKKETAILKSELASLEHLQQETNNDVFKQIMEDIADLQKDYLKLQLLDVNEATFLKQQYGQLTIEKQKIEQHKMLLEGKVDALEHDVGFE